MIAQFGQASIIAASAPISPLVEIARILGPCSARNACGSFASYSSRKVKSCASTSRSQSGNTPMISSSGLSIRHASP